jgi:hypothetical protein
VTATDHATVGADINFYFDPVCPFAWMTSKWVRTVTAQRGYEVDWRFISLRMVNDSVDYASAFPPGYESGHTAGLRLLRLAAAVRAEHGRERVGALYASIGSRVFDTHPGAGPETGSRAFVEPVLAELGLQATMADTLDDSSFDAELRRETDEALSLAGKDPPRRSYMTHASFSDPDGNGWLLQEITERLPGR